MKNEKHNNAKAHNKKNGTQGTNQKNKKAYAITKEFRNNSYMKVVTVIFAVLILSLLTFCPLFAGNQTNAAAENQESTSYSSSANQSSQDTSTNPYHLQKSGKLIVANSPDYPPFSELSGDEVVGYEPDIWKEIAKRLNLEAEVKIMNFDTILPAVASGVQCDIGMAGISIDPEREKIANFSDSYYTADISFAVPDGESITAQNADQKFKENNFKFAVQSGTTAEIYVKENYPQARIMDYSSSNDCFAAVAAGQADAVCSTKAVVTNMLRGSYSDMKIVKTVATGEEYGIAINKDNAELLNAVNTTLAAMKSDGTLQALASKNGITAEGGVDAGNTLDMKTVKCTASPNRDATSVVISGKPTRITWEGQAGVSEKLTGFSFTFPPGTEFDPQNISVTILSGEDLLTRTKVKCSAESDGDTITIKFTNPQQVKPGGYYRVEFHDVILPSSSTNQISLTGEYALDNGAVKQINDIPPIVVEAPTWLENLADKIDNSQFGQAWNSVTFLNLFLNPAVFLRSIPFVFQGFLMALAIVLVSFPVAVPFGLLLALMRISKRKVLRGVATTYVNIVRGTPLFLQIYIAFFGLPLAGITVPNFPLGVIVLAMNSSAYLCEIFRAGIQSVPAGQFEAARSLGMTPKQTMFYIIIPQTVKRVLPTMASEFILLYKDTSLLASVGVMEIVMYAKTIVASTGSITPYVVAALFYMVITLPLAKIVSHLEAYFTKSRSVPATKDKDEDKPEKSDAHNAEGEEQAKDVKQPSEDAKHSAPAHAKHKTSNL